MPAQRALKVPRRTSSIAVLLIFIVGLGFFGGRLWHDRGPRDSLLRAGARRAEGVHSRRLFQGDPDAGPLEDHSSGTQQETGAERRSYDEEMEKAAVSHQTIQLLETKVSSLELELMAARAVAAVHSSGNGSTDASKRKVFMVVGVNTAFSSRSRRDSYRETWFPTGDRLKRLDELGIICRFVIGHSASRGGALDQAIEREHEQFGDFLRLDHVEGYLELSAKTKTYFATALATWDAEYYLKVDDDIHVNLGALASTLASHRAKPRAYIGCMKTGPVLSQTEAKYHEPEHWKFGEEGSYYFRHASGQMYALSKDLATYVSINQAVLHKYANEDVSLGAWMIGLDVDHIHAPSLCCGTPPNCEWKAQAGNVCAGIFDWTCAGICKSIERLPDVHRKCGEGDDAVWNTAFLHP